MRSMAFLLTAWLGAIAVSAAPPSAPIPPTTVLLVRHAEKQAGDDPALTEPGRARAAALAHVGLRAGVAAVYATTLRRTSLTVKPLADALDLEVTTLAPDATAELVARLRTAHPGQTVIVAGHSNTIPEILAALGVPGVTIDHDDYDDLFVVHLDGDGRVTSTHLQYGAPTPVAGDD